MKRRRSAEKHHFNETALSKAMVWIPCAVPLGSRQVNATDGRLSGAPL
jgi:hypothetical protein